MSGEGIRRSIWIVLLPVIFLFAILVLILIAPVISAFGSSMGLPDFSGISSGIAAILPEIGAGLAIGMIFIVFAIMSRRRK